MFRLCGCFFTQISPPHIWGHPHTHAEVSVAERLAQPHLHRVPTRCCSPHARRQEHTPPGRKRGDESGRILTAAPQIPLVLTVQLHTHTHARAHMFTHAHTCACAHTHTLLSGEPSWGPRLRPGTLTSAASGEACWEHVDGGGGPLGVLQPRCGELPVCILPPRPARENLDLQ